MIERSFALISGLAFATACAASLDRPAEAVTETHALAKPVAVRVAEVREAPATRAMIVHGVTRSMQRGRLGFLEGGRVVVRPVRVGQRVAAGDVLAVVDPEATRNQARAAWAQVAQLEARATGLRSERNRLEALTGGRSVSQAELDRIVAESDATDAALSAAQAAAAEGNRRANDTTLRAPYAGVVMAVMAEPGETLAPGQPVVELAGEGVLEVEVQVPETSWAHLHVGDVAEVWLPALGQHTTATLTEVATAARPEGLFPVLVALDPTDLAAGLTAEVRLALPLSADASVPLSAIVDPIGSQPSVLRVVDGYAQRVNVQPDQLLLDAVAVRGTLSPGDQVVVAGHGRLLDGDAVRVLP
jgi:RND family efflux transporter MFP subunit